MESQKGSTVDGSTVDTALFETSLENSSSMMYDGIESMKIENFHEKIMAYEVHNVKIEDTEKVNDVKIEEYLDEAKMKIDDESWELELNLTNDSSILPHTEKPVLEELDGINKKNLETSESASSSNGNLQLSNGSIDKEDKERVGTRETAETCPQKKSRLKKTFQCSVCSFKTLWKHHFQNHLLTHSNIKLGKCSRCNCEYNLKQQFKKHLFSQSNTKLFKCSECNCYRPSKIQNSINDLNDLIHLFALKSFEDQLKIVKTGRPKPALQNLVSKHKDKNHEYTRRFSVAQYNERQWLTGCEFRSKLFCWPCLLFSDENGVWSKHGFDDLNHLTTALQRHEKSRDHVLSCFTLHMFGKQRRDTLTDNQRKADICRHNSQVKKNRDILKRLIDAVCFHAVQELPLRDHDESLASEKRGNYKEFLNVLRKYDLLLDTHLDTSPVFQGASPSMQNDIIQSLSIVVKHYIKMEINSATFVAIILDETSNVMAKSKLSTIFRLVRGGQVYERFVGFSDVSADKTADGLFRHVVGVVEEFQIQDKLVGQTCDGASVMGGHINDLQKKILDKYPYAIFTHCYAHVFNLVLQQSLSSIRECNIFFQTLNELGAYFSKSSKRVEALHEFISGKLPSVASMIGNFTSRLTNTIQQYRVHLTDFFKNILENPQNWNPDSIWKARGFINFLEEFQTILFLEIFSKLFEYTDTLYNILQTTKDVMYCCSKVSEVLQQMKYDGDHGFEDLWNSALSNGVDTEEPLYKRARKFMPENDAKEAYCQLYRKIADDIGMQIETRFSSLSVFEFFQLLWYENYDKFKISFPENLLEKVKCQYGVLFDYIRLKNELCVLYASPDFSKMHIFELIEFMAENSLTTAFKEVFKLAELILTIPSNTPAERSFSTLRRIHTCYRGTQNQDWMASLNLLSIEKKLLTDLKQGTSFYDDVIEQFLLQERRIELIYK